MELVQRVSRKFADLSPQLQLAARFVIDHPDEIATHVPATDCKAKRPFRADLFPVSPAPLDMTNTKP